MTQPPETAAAGAPGLAGGGAAAGRVGMFTPLRVPSYLRLWLGSTVVFLGVMAQSIARSWLAFDLTGSNAALGGVLLAFGLAMVVATPFGGVVGDRWPKRAVLQCSLVLLAVTSAWVGVALALDVLAYWMLLVAGALQAVAFSFYAPARMAFVSELVPADELPEAVALMLLNVEASRVAGPALAGLVLGSVSFGPQAVFAACTVLFVGGLLAGVGLPAGRPSRHGPALSPLGDLRAGLSYLAARPPLTRLMLCTFGVVMIGLPYLAFLPTVSDGLFDHGSSGYGLLSASSAVGAVLAGLFVGRLRRALGPWRLVVAAGAVFGLALLGLALAPTFAVAVLVLVPAGAGLLVFQTATQALLMALSDVTFHGRVQGLLMLGIAGFGVMALPLGLLADAVGLRQTLAGMAVGVLLVLVAFAVVSRRHWGEERLLDLG